MTLYTICIYLAPRVTTLFSFFFFNATPTTEIYTLSLHDALPISLQPRRRRRHDRQRHGFRLRPLALFPDPRSEEHTSELQSHSDLVCRLLLEKKKKNYIVIIVLHCNDLDDVKIKSLILLYTYVCI